MATNDRSTVVGVFEIRSEADAAIHELQRAGFRDDQLGFVAHEGDSGVVTSTVEDKAEGGTGAAAGVVSGGIIGGIIGAAAALLIPGLGPAIAGGILVPIFSGAALGAAAGGVLGALTNLGVPEEEARYYEGEFTTGRTLVTVRADGRQQEAINILHHNGGYDAGMRLAQPQAPADQMDINAPRQYDPVTGVIESGDQHASVSSGSVGLQRDPSVETDTAAGTNDTLMRPDTAVEEGSKDSFFQRPMAPGTVESGSAHDPNVQLPRFP